MDKDTPSWLPELILFENYKGNWDAYVDTIYQYFHADFIRNRTSFQRAPIFVRHHPSHDKKGATFWHLISEGDLESERTPDLRRCERIRWPKPIIESPNTINIRIWETVRPWKNQKQRRIIFAPDNFSYIVVIAETSRGFNLITAYCVEKPHQRQKLRKEFEAFSKQKKEGAAV